MSSRFVECTPLSLARTIGDLCAQLTVTEAVVIADASTTYSFDANGDAVPPVMSIYRVQNGAWTYLHQIDAT